MGKRILLVVEPNFLTEHVGVRRVISYLWRTWLRQGNEVDFAAPIAGNFVRPHANRIFAALAIHVSDPSCTKTAEPTWVGHPDEPTVLPSQEDSYHKDHETVSQSASVWNPHDNAQLNDYDETVLTVPWLSRYAQITASRFTIGIVYDVAPNLLAIGVLRLPQYVNINDFAHQHADGFKIYVETCRLIICISDASKNDFSQLYRQVRLNLPCEVCIPFSNDSLSLRSQRGHAILLCNVLDHRKNFATVKKTMDLWARSGKKSLEIIIVGRERMAFSEVQTFLRDLCYSNHKVTWYRAPSDEAMQGLISQSRVLFFPSIYEGLGLPILEAQAMGVPVISSNVPACQEVNRNPSLVGDPYDAEFFVGCLDRVLDDTVSQISWLEGEALRLSQEAFLKNKNDLVI